MAHCRFWNTFLCAIGAICGSLSVAPLRADPLHDLLMAEYLSPSAAEKFLQEAGVHMDVLFSDGESYDFLVNGARISIAIRGPRLQVTTEEESVTVPINGAPLKPLIATTPLTIFDILSPYFAWPSATYEGPKKITGRYAQRFLLEAPSDLWKPIAKVRIWLDEKYYYPLAWDALDENNRVIRRLRLRSITCNAGDEWELKKVDISAPEERQIIRVEFLKHSKEDEVF
jgi:hypothetical protein